VTRDQAEAFAREWIETWNRLDVEGILAHFDDAARFTSPKAAQRVGRATVEGKEDLRVYWSAAAAAISSITFTLDHVLWDADRRELVIVYDAEINGQKNRACEFLRFGEGGHAVQGEAMYGAQT
jgi:hypothetical protein